MTGSATLGTATLTAGVAALGNVAATAANGLGLGEYLVTASYAGDANFAASSGSFGLVVYNPALPLPLGLSPSSKTTGGANFILTVTGGNFTSTSVVLWNGAVRTTVFVSGTQLTADIKAADIAKEATDLVTVANSAPNPGTSSALPFVVQSSTPVATISGASISASADGSGNYALTLTGADFVTGSLVDWNNTSFLTTNYVSPWQISAAITAAEYASLPATVKVVNPSGPATGFELQ